MLQRMTPEDYSKFWEIESSQFQSSKIYDQLSKTVPTVATLEIGCGAGWSTLSLAISRPVLAVDNNPYLIDLARARLQKHGVNAEIIQSDLFEPSAELLTAIRDFQPEVVVGWFIGSHPDDNDKRTPAHLDIREKPKVYRENVEDRLLVQPLCPPSVKWIHMVQRASIPPGYTETQIKEGAMEDYEKYVFANSDFTVKDVGILDWDRGESHFPYVQNQNSNLQSGNAKPIIVSVLAHRVQNEASR